MAGPTGAHLRAHDKRIRGMLTDPDCVGELLLVGIGMARCLDLGEPGWVDGHMPMPLIAEAIYGTRPLPTRLVGVGKPHTTADSDPRRRISAVFRSDRRRYDPDFDAGPAWHGVTCGRPMLRRDGLCGRNTSRSRRLTDPADGSRRWVGACSNRLCQGWLADLVARNAAELKANPAPVPAANSGGVLERHLPEINWWKVWRHVDKDWTPPPEGRRFERPKLTLVMGEPEEVLVVAPRPELVVHEGGWR